MSRTPSDSLPDPDSTRRLLAWVVAAVALSALLTVAGGGMPVLLVGVVLVFLLWTLHDPLVTVPLIVLSQVIWLIGNYAPGGVAMLSPSKLALLLALGVWLVHAVREHIPPTYAPHMLPLGLFGLVVLLGPVLTPVFDDAVTGIGKYAVMFLPYLLIANLAITRRGLTIAAASLTLTATVSAGLAMVERFLPGVQLAFDGIGLGAHVDDNSLSTVILRVTGGIGDANWFSYTMATALPLCLYWWRAYPGFWIRAAVAGAALLQFAGLIFSYTRTPMVGLAGAIVLLVWLRRIALGPVVAATVLAAVTAPLWLPEGFIERFTSKQYIEEGSTPMRREIFNMALDLVVDKPLLGHGYQQYGPQFIARSTSEIGAEWERRDISGEEPAHLLRAHNLYLDVWVQHGLIGLIPLMLAYALLLRELLQIARADADSREGELAACLLACLVSFYLCGIGGHSQELKIFWIMAGLAAALRRVFWTNGPYPLSRA